jgi:hypothetical protein
LLLLLLLAQAGQMTSCSCCCCCCCCCAEPICLMIGWSPELLRNPCAPLTTQLYQMEQLSPTLTSPDTWADGAIQVVLATWGSL